MKRFSLLQNNSWISGIHFMHRSSILWKPSHYRGFIDRHEYLGAHKGGKRIKGDLRNSACF